MTSVTLNYQIDNGTISTYNWTGNLISIGKSKITLPMQTVTAGAHTFNAYTTMPNGTADDVPSNDVVTNNFSSITKGNISLTEGFEGIKFPPIGWKFAGPDIAWSWEKKTGGTSGGNGQSASSIRFNNYTPDIKGKRYSIRTPQYDFTSSTTPVLTYDYAYDYATYNDSLIVYYSKDCGSTWKTLLKKGGSGLNTCATPSTSPVFIPKSSEWKKETINLSNLIGEPRIMFSFENLSGFGNMIYLDNINLTGVTGIVDEALENNTITIYPNPSIDGIFNLNIQNIGESCSICLIDLTGKTLISRELKAISGTINQQLDVTDFSKGIYFLRIKTEQGYETKKLVIQ